MKSKDQQLLEEAYAKINETCISDDFVTRYDDNMRKYKEGELDRQQWVDVSLLLLQDIIEMKRKDIATPERDISEEEDEQMIAADLANRE